MRGTTLIRRWRQGLSLRSQLKARVGRADGSPRFAGVSLRAPDAVAAWAISRQIADGEYAHPGLMPERGERVVDIGANIGVYSLWAARRGARVTAYEPAPSTFLDLVANVSRASHITPVQAAVVGATPPGQSVTLFLHDERSTRNTLLGREIGTGDTLGRSVEVPAVGIADVLAEECDLLKVDCEGGEFDIFKAADDFSLRRARRIVLEFHRVAGDIQELVDRLASAGFRTAILQGADLDDPFGVIGALRNDIR
jgi:FkbM family methyltransferase